MRSLSIMAFSIGVFAAQAAEPVVIQGEVVSILRTGSKFTVQITLASGLAFTAKDETVLTMDGKAAFFDESLKYETYGSKLKAKFTIRPDDASVAKVEFISTVKPPRFFEEVDVTKKGNPVKTVPPTVLETETTVKEKKHKTVIKVRTTSAALDRLNGWRAQRGLFPYVFDEGLTRAAEKCAQIKAQNCHSGHLSGPMSDFACLEPGVQCSSTGADGSKIHASDTGWFSCCADDTQYRYAGAAVFVGPDNCQYFSLFVR